MLAARDSSQAIEQARELAHQALSIARGGDPATPLSFLDRALALLTPIGPSETLADVLRWKGNVLRDCGDHAPALDLYAQSLAIADATFYTIGRAHALNCFGTMEQFRGDLARAVTWYHSAKRLADGLGDKRLVGMIEQNLGIVAAIRGQSQEALAHFRAALIEFERLGDEKALLWVLNNMGNLYTREGSYDLAGSVLHGALDLALALGDVASEGVVQENRSQLLLETGHLDEAQKAAERALEIATQRRDATRQAAALRTHARIMRRREVESSEVIAVLDRALALAQTGEDVELKGEILREIAISCEDSGNPGKASSYRQAAARLEGRTGEAAPPG